MCERAKCPKKLVPFFRRSIAKHPESSTLKIRFGELLQKLKQPDKARGEFESALEVSSEKDRSRWAIAEAHEKNRNWASAVNEYLRLAKDYPTSQLALGALLRTAKLYWLRLPDGLERALATYQDVIDSYPDGSRLWEAYKGLGDIQQQTGVNIEAIGSYYMSIELYRKSHPHSLNFVPQYYDIARCYKRLGDYAKAIEIYKMLVDNYPRHASEAKNMIHRDESCAKEAKEIQKKLENCTESRERAQLLNQIASYYRGTTWNYPMAIETYQTITKDPLISELSKTRALKAIGECYQEVGNNAKAIEIFDEILKDEAKKRMAGGEKLSSKKALCLANMKEEEEAIEGLKKYLEEHPRDKEKSTVLYRLGCTFYKRGEFAEAAKCFEVYLEIATQHNKHFDAELWLAECYEALGEIQKALEGYRSFVKKHPDAWPIARRITVLDENAD